LIFNGLQQIIRKRQNHGGQNDMRKPFIEAADAKMPNRRQIGLEECHKIGERMVVSVKQIQSALTMLSLEEKQAVRDFLDDLIEDQLELESGFKQKIERAKNEIAEGVYSRVRQPQPDR
jgi:hypothetical protein